ncbi:MAG: hypothetical protein J1G04_03230, partial [Clostridiales bacterium]|nr:hypothetical protein [Clostridiales bacterium]
KVELSNIVLGGKYVCDGTEHNIASMTKSLSNAKPVEDEQEYEKPSTIDQVTVQTVTCAGAAGTISWRNNSWSTLHPAQYVKVEAYSSAVSDDVPLGTSYTDVHGKYDIYFSRNDIQSDDVYILVYTEGANVTVCNSKHVAYVYSTKGTIIPDFENSRAQLNVNVEMSNRFGQALQISQSAITAARYAAEMNNSALTEVYIIYPYIPASS